jgi:hypothetical protein
MLISSTPLRSKQAALLQVLCVKCASQPITAPKPLRINLTPVRRIEGRSFERSE